MIVRFISIVALLVFSIGCADAGIRLKTACQKNLADGRVLVQDYRALPTDGSTFKVLGFKARKRDGDWAYGPCLLDVKP